ncbi:MAG: PepSY domain-containing protein [Clostridium sp.]|nr:PepSY domain-containing protein [Clostridium sp.]
MKMRSKFLMIFVMVCLVAVGVCLSSEVSYAKGITSVKQAEKKALQEVKGAMVTEVDMDYENGTLVYEIQLMKGTKEYDITYRASDGKKIAYGWEENNTGRYSKKKIMSESKCRTLAKKKVKGAKITSITSKYDDGINIYKVKMSSDTKKYELKYNARTRKLIDYEWELVSKKTNNQSAYIGKDKAKEIALGKVPGARVIKVELDKDDGVPVYEVELIKDSYEYEIKIHAKTGKILEFESEPIDDDDYYYYD